MNSMTAISVGGAVPQRGGHGRECVDNISTRWTWVHFRARSAVVNLESSMGRYGS